jgi:6-phosphofructokinase 1
LVCQEVNFTLIPEVPFALHGERGFLAALEQRMAARGHAVIAVAEGADQDPFTGEPGTDASGSCKLHDVGPFLKQQIVDYFKAKSCPAEVKYIDPSYIVRSVPANAEDAFLCDFLARCACHAALAGRTDLMIGFRNNTYIHVPIPMAVERKRRVNP